MKDLQYRCVRTEESRQEYTRTQEYMNSLLRSRDLTRVKMSIDVNHIRGFRTRDSVTSESCIVTNYTKRLETRVSLV